MDLDHLEKKLKGISEDLEKEEDLLKDLVKNSLRDPEKLARDLATEFGFEYVETN